MKILFDDEHVGYARELMDPMGENTVGDSAREAVRRLAVISRAKQSEAIKMVNRIRLARGERPIPK